MPPFTPPYSRSHPLASPSRPPFTPLYHLPSHLPHASPQVLREAAEDAALAAAAALKAAALAAKGKPHTGSGPHPTGRDPDSATSVDLKSAVRRVETLGPAKLAQHTAAIVQMLKDRDSGVLRTAVETLDKLSSLKYAPPACACTHTASRCAYSRSPSGGWRRPL